MTFVTDRSKKVLPYVPYCLSDVCLRPSVCLSFDIRTHFIYFYQYDVWVAVCFAYGVSCTIQTLAFMCLGTMEIT